MMPVFLSSLFLLFSSLAEARLPEAELKALKAQKAKILADCDSNDASCLKGLELQNSATTISFEENAALVADLLPLPLVSDGPDRNSPTGAGEAGSRQGSESGSSNK